MESVFVILFLISFGALVVGLIRPSAVRVSTRGKALRNYGLATLAFFILVGVVADPVETDATRSTEEPAVRNVVNNPAGSSAVAAGSADEAASSTQQRDRPASNDDNSTPYGSCSDRAEAYQNQYERTSQASDLVCYQKALERELGGSQEFDCPRNAQHYQSAYERSGNSSDLVCYQQALERELQ